MSAFDWAMIGEVTLETQCHWSATPIFPSFWIHNVSILFISVWASGRVKKYGLATKACNWFLSRIKIIDKNKCIEFISNHVAHI